MENVINTYKPSLIKLQALKSFLQSYCSKISFYNYDLKYIDDKQFENTYTEGIKGLLTFSRNYNLSTMLKAAKKFMEASKIKPNAAAPYVSLAWLYFLAEDKSSCNEYLAIAEKVEPNFPDMKKIKNLLLAI